ncbi:MAG: aldehyde dehydrogenase family protein, partial [Nitriliruptoraceae bacterium]
ARAAQPGWAGATAYNRGQVLYRIAEMLEGRRDQFIRSVASSDDRSAAEAEQTVGAAIDRWVWYAGWSDKFAQVAGAGNPVAGPFFNLSVPEPVGVVAAIAPQQSSLLGLVSVIAPIIVAGNTVVVVASEARPLPALELAEVLATSDVPAGVVNILTGHTSELAPVLAAHLDVNAFDAAGLAGSDTTDVEIAAADNVKRVVRAPQREPDFTATPNGPERILTFCETKTVWHPKGL